MSAASGLEHLKPFLPGLESALEDSEVSEIMINGPGNVWVERAGRLAAHAAPDLDERGAVTGRYPHRPSFGTGPVKLSLLSMPGSMTDRGLLSAFRPPVLKSLSPCGALVSGPSRRMTS